MTWTKSKRGEYWNSGPWSICTFYTVTNGVRGESGYRLYYQKNDSHHMADYATLGEAKRAAGRFAVMNPALCDELNRREARP